MQFAVCRPEKDCYGDWMIDTCASVDPISPVWGLAFSIDFFFNACILI